MHELVSSIIGGYLLEPGIYDYMLWFFLYLTLPCFVFYVLDRDAVKNHADKYITEENKKWTVLHFIFRQRYKLLIISTCIGMMTLKYIFLVEVTEPVSSIKGMKQRVDIYNKLIEYKNDIDDNRYERKRKVHIPGMNQLLFWYEKPTLSEIHHLEEYLIKFFTIYDKLLKERKISIENDSFNIPSNLKNTRSNAIQALKPVNNLIRRIDSKKVKDPDLFIEVALRYYFGYPKKLKDIYNSDQDKVKND